MININSTVNYANMEKNTAYSIVIEHCKRMMAEAEKAGMKVDCMDVCADINVYGNLAGDKSNVRMVIYPARQEAK